jgi:hypothetical protein
VVWITLEFSSFKIGGLSSSARGGGAVSGSCYFVPHSFVAGGN